MGFRDAGNGLADAAAKLVAEGTPSVDRLRCEEEIETTEHVLLRCPARQYATESFPATLDLRSAWYNATATEMLATFVQRTLTAYPLGSTPLRS